MISGIISSLFILLIYFDLTLVHANNDVSHPPASLRLPLIRRSINNVDTYFVRMTIGTPPQEVILNLDSRNEGLRLFVPLNKNINYEPEKNKNLSFEQSQHNQNQTKNSHGLKLEEQFIPDKSKTILYCTSPQRCSSTWYSNGSYECLSPSKNPKDAHYFNYSSLAPSAFFSTDLCEERAEALDLIQFPNASMKLQNEGGTELEPFMLWKAPIKLVRRLWPCTSNITLIDDLNIDYLSDIGDFIFRLFLESELEMNDMARRSLKQKEETVDGIWGIAARLLLSSTSRLLEHICSGPSCRPISLLSQTLEQSEMSIVTIDLTPIDTPSLTFSSSSSQSVIWSESKQQNIPDVQTHDFFTSYDWRICNVDIGYNVSSHWGTVIDLNTPCLGLPSSLWEAVMSWIPVKCPKGATRCHLVPELSSLHPLPSLSFSLQQSLTSRFLTNRRQNGMSISPYGDYETQSTLAMVSEIMTETKRVEFPLNGLIIKPSQEICIDKLQDDLFISSDGHFHGTPSSILPSIRIGSMILRQYAISMDHKSNKVGFLPNDVKLPSSDESCIRKQSCRGQQTFYPPTNTCVNPNCNAWFFKALNEHTGNCEYISSLSVVLCIIVPLFVIVDLLSDGFYWKTVDFAKQRCR